MCSKTSRNKMEDLKNEINELAMNSKKMIVAGVT